jgi:hypothetical protein
MVDTVSAFRSVSTKAGETHRRTSPASAPRTHLHGVHLGFLRVRGRAPDALQWELGGFRACFPRVNTPMPENAPLAGPDALKGKAAIWRSAEE